MERYRSMMHQLLVEDPLLKERVVEHERFKRRTSLLAQLAMLDQVIDSAREEARALLEKRTYSEDPREKLNQLDRLLLTSRRTRARLDRELAALRLSSARG